MNLEQLRANLMVAMYEADEAKLRFKKLEQEYAEAKAVSVGVKIGSIVATLSNRYRVTRIEYCYYGQYEIRLSGTNIRKDGTAGQHREIRCEWTVEKS